MHSSVSHSKGEIMLCVDDTNNIKSKSDFVIFLQKLCNDYKTHGTDWENSDLGSFLDALIAYTEDVDGFYQNQGETIDLSNPGWKVFADILAGARIYE